MGISLQSETEKRKNATGTIATHSTHLIHLQSDVDSATKHPPHSSVTSFTKDTDTDLITVFVQPLAK